MLWRTAFTKLPLHSPHQLCGLRFGQQLAGGASRSSSRSFTFLHHQLSWQAKPRFGVVDRRELRTLSLRPSRGLRRDLNSTRTSLQEELVESVHPSFEERVAKPGVSRQVLFVLFICSFGFLNAAIVTNYHTAFWKAVLEKSPIWQVQTITSLDLKRAQNSLLIKKLRDGYAWVTQRARTIPGTIGSWLSVAYISAMQPYADASEGKRLCWKICLLNLAVWVAWKVPTFQASMARRFMHNPLSGLSYTLLTSMFSHKSFLHLALNCLALEGFGSAAYFYLLKEQEKFDPPMLESSTNWHFLAFFVSAGLFSGLVSHVVAAKFQYPRFIAQLYRFNPAKKRTDTWADALVAESTRASAGKAAADVGARTILPSLGASGAIYAAVTVTALGFPESHVSLFIPPSNPIPIQWAVGGLVTMDVVGILRGWRFFDHWAHLGGAVFGVAYYNYGPRLWDWLRRYTDERWTPKVVVT
ncbi:hypothetical protein AX16_003279 [Volvariella volvacea WC 439]|nr:hypothetical protein AX16_003279 [Volvariella volvacea WC 439]